MKRKKIKIALENLLQTVYNKDMKTTETILNISFNVNAGRSFDLMLGDWLDEFYRSSPDVQAEMFREAPLDMAEPPQVPFLASAVHKLANDNGLEVPAWVFEPRCYLPGSKPFFGCNARGNLRLMFMYISPSEFKHRNLFVDENVLARV